MTKPATVLLTGASMLAISTAYAANAPADFIIAGGTPIPAPTSPPPSPTW